MSARRSRSLLSMCSPLTADDFPRSRNTLLLERSMTKPIRVGLVGSKFAARFHWDGIRRVYGVPVEVVGVTSKSAEARDAFARERGIRSFQTLEEMYALVDVVDLCTPPSSHENLAVRALEQGKHVIIEKPLTGYFDSGTQGFQGNRFP